MIIDIQSHCAARQATLEAAADVEACAMALEAVARLQTHLGELYGDGAHEALGLAELLLAAVAAAVARHDDRQPEPFPLRKPGAP